MSKIATITVSDEVNVTISGLEVADRRLLVKQFEFMVPGAQFLPSVRLGRWNGKTSFFTIGGSTYLNLLEEILPILDSRGYDIVLNDTREYSASFEFDIVNADTFKHKVWPSGHHCEGQPIVLRDYQIEVINNFLLNPQSMIEAATGAGKTLITAALSSAIEAYGRSLVIVPSVNLVTQTEADYINMGLDVGVYYGNRKDIGKKHTICTWQSMNALIKSTKTGEVDFTIQDFLQDVVCVIVDEAHGTKATALKTMLAGIMSKVPIRWGMTGTIPKEKMDQLSLLVSIGPVISNLAAKTLQDQGVLANCHVNIIQLQDDVDFKDYPSELKYLTTDDKRMQVIAEEIKNINSSGNTLVLVDRINAGNLLLTKLTGMLSEEDVVFVSGGTKATTRTEQYEDVATSSNKIIIATYGVAAVGINIPRLFNVVLIEPGKSFVRTIQSIGRGLRMATDKSFVQITDITSNCKFSKRHLTARKQFYKEAQYEFTLSKKKYK